MDLSFRRSERAFVIRPPRKKCIQSIHARSAAGVPRLPAARVVGMHLGTLRAAPKSAGRYAPTRALPRFVLKPEAPPTASAKVSMVLLAVPENGPAMAARSSSIRPGRPTAHDPARREGEAMRPNGSRITGRASAIPSAAVSTTSLGRPRSSPGTSRAPACNARCSVPISGTRSMSSAWCGPRRPGAALIPPARRRAAPGRRSHSVPREPAAAPAWTTPTAAPGHCDIVVE